MTTPMFEADEAAEEAIDDIVLDAKEVLDEAGIAGVPLSEVLPGMVVLVPFLVGYPGPGNQVVAYSDAIGMTGRWSLVASAWVVQTGVGVPFEPVHLRFIKRLVKRIRDLESKKR